MARKLPWDTTGKSSTAKVKKAKTSAKSSTKPKQMSSPDDDDSESTNSVELPRRKVPKRKSPAPSRAKTPVEEVEEESHEKEEVELMEEGDDVYMMVEDEFLTTAKKFTRHIHQAALEEMEKAAKTKSQETVAALSRPVSIPMPDQTKRKLEGQARAKRQGDGVQKLLSKIPGGDDDEDDDLDAKPAWIGTSLHCLMEAPKKPPPSLARLLKVKKEDTEQEGKAIKPLKGLGQSTSQSQSASLKVSNPTKQKSSILEEVDSETATEDDDDDDLDAPPKAAKFSSNYWAQTSKLSGPAASSSRTSLFSKPKSSLNSEIGARVSKEVPRKELSTVQSAVNQPLPVERTASRSEGVEQATSSTTSSEPVEGESRLAQIKKKLRAERMARESKS